MGGKKRKTVYQTTLTPNDYDDAWIRQKFGELDQQALGFSNWQAGRQASLGREQDIRDQLRTGLSGLQADFAGARANIENLQRGEQALTSDFAGLSGAQQQQMKDLYNLAQEGKGVTGVRSQGGLTFTKPRVSGTGSLNRNQLQSGSLNI
tara:strand:- start:20 stop:469 length:450 start_codon:yes stop_codon:yes gene_type:complete